MLPPEAQEAFRTAAAIAHAAGRKVALTLSDPFCVERHRAEFRDLVENHVDILFANELEICTLYQVPSVEAAVPLVRGHCDLAALTRSAKGSLLAPFFAEQLAAHLCGEGEIEEQVNVARFLVHPRFSK